MTADQTPLSPEPGPDAGIDDIQADIEHTRKELGETIEALSAKADVKGRVKQKGARRHLRPNGGTPSSTSAPSDATPPRCCCAICEPQTITRPPSRQSPTRRSGRS